MHWALTCTTLLYSVLYGLLWVTPVLSTQPSNIHATQSQNGRVIKIILKGSTHLRDEVILAKLPYKVGDVFDPNLSEQAIHQLYGLGYFNNVELDVARTPKGNVVLYVLLSENKLLSGILFEGNNSVSEKDLREKLNLGSLETINEEFATSLAKRIKQLYIDEGFHQANICFTLKKQREDSDAVTLTFTIEEGTRSYIARVLFSGNRAIPDHKLRSILFTRERWLLSFMDGSGKFEKEQFDIDARRIEMLYRDFGYLNAKVTDVSLDFSPDGKEIFVTFSIHEGQPYIVSSISAPGDDIFLEEELEPLIYLKKGYPYSHTKLGETIEALKAKWGSKGYINADVYPQIIPNDDEHTVAITLMTERGSLVKVNRIDITGNTSTRDKVIRREILLEEGDIITSKALQDATNSVERLSFFERGGVNWRMHRIADDLADLEMNVKETKTGNFSLNFTYGSEPNSNERAVKIMLQASQSNFLGRGWSIGLNAQGQIHRNGSQNFEGFFTDPYLFNRNISGTFSAYHRKEEFQEWRSVNRTPVVSESGGAALISFRLPYVHRYFEITGEIGWEFINGKTSAVNGGRPELCATGPCCESLQEIINRAFKTGGYQWLGVHMLYDTRNHRIYPNHGHRVHIGAITALPFLNNNYSFFKTELEASYYTPVIGTDSLVLALHAKAGFIANLVNDKYIPYKEMFHMGGQTTVRGFSFGSIEPSWDDRNPLGARKAVQLNAELIFPILPDFSMKGHFFYDGGAGWDTPTHGIPVTSLIVRNKFNWRHAVGFGLNILRPMPAKIDWGYKLDRDKEAGESPYEFHVQMNAAW